MAKILDKPFDTPGDVETQTTCGFCCAVFSYKQRETYDRVNPNYRPIDWRIFVKCPNCHNQLVVGRYERG